MHIADLLRKRVVQDLFEMPSFKNHFPSWREFLINSTARPLNSNDLLDFGELLSRAFQQTGKSRSQDTQSTVSTGGNAWEGLVCWYMNLILAGSRAVVVKKAATLPEVLRDSFATYYGSVKCNTEADLIVVVFPNSERYRSSISSLVVDGERFVSDSAQIVWNSRSIGCLEQLFEADHGNFELGLVQCKTNWNDNAQIPMLWDFLYRAEQFESNAVKIGGRSVSIKDLQKFTYSFVTVPTGAEEHNENALKVKRVRNLSGGNYWGRPTKQGVSLSLDNIFHINYESAFDGSIASSLKLVSNNLDKKYSYFCLGE